MTTIPAQDPLEAATVSAAEGQAQADLLKFLYEQRLKLFNIRQDHEWKIFFAVAILLGVVDAAILANGIRFEGAERFLWFGACVLAAAACLGYETGLQARNRTDRHVLDVLSRRLCGLGKVPDGSAARWGVETPLRKGKHAEDASGLWAFKWQVVTICLIAVVSGLAPFVRRVK